MGRGPAGSGDNATAVSRHCSSVMQFFLKGLCFKGFGQIVAPKTEQSFCSRVLANAGLHFAQRSGLRLAADASRHGGRDILMILVSGFRVDGYCCDAWAPPQVHMVFGMIA
jgi:hypothetical protein